MFGGEADEEYVVDFTEMAAERKSTRSGPALSLDLASFQALRKARKRGRLARH
jgi:hypothetical protein